MYVPPAHRRTGRADPNKQLQTPPLSHSYDHSASCSESGYQYPTTPLSMPASPRLLAQI
jgi:hypothetical protein